jgi:hypothetical protein
MVTGLLSPRARKKLAKTFYDCRNILIWPFIGKHFLIGTINGSCFIYLVSIFGGNAFLSPSSQKTSVLKELNFDLSQFSVPSCGIVQAVEHKSLTNGRKKGELVLVGTPLSDVWCVFVCSMWWNLTFICAIFTMWKLGALICCKNPRELREDGMGLWIDAFLPLLCNVRGGN